MCTISEKNVIDSIIDSEKGSQLAGELDYKIIQSRFTTVFIEDWKRILYNVKCTWHIVHLYVLSLIIKKWYECRCTILCIIPLNDM